jgi:hypothetical protein
MGKGCKSCGGTLAPKRDRMAGLVGRWSVRWPHGVLQAAKSEEHARRMAAEAKVELIVLPPAPDPDDVVDEDPPIVTTPTEVDPNPGLRGPA